MLAHSLLALLATGLLSSAKPLPTDRYRHHRRHVDARDSTAAVAVPATYAEGYLEPYATYHARYLALKCQDEHDTQFFDDCCHPMLATENLVDNRKPYCTPGSAAYESAFPSSAVAAASATTSEAADANGSDAVATAAYVAVTTASSAPAASSSSVGGDDDDDDDWEWCEEDDDSEEEDEEETTTSAVPTSSLVASATAIAEAYHAEYQATSAGSSSAATSETPAPSTASATTSTTSTTSTTTGAAAASSSSSGSTSLSGTVETGGYATYFYQGGNAGACGIVHSDADKVIAIDSNGWWPGSFGAPSPYCGKYINIKNLNNGNTVQAMVADVCPTCTTDNSLDLSLGAFEALADLSEGMVPIEWSFA